MWTGSVELGLCLDPVKALQHNNTILLMAHVGTSLPPRTRAERAASCLGANANERQPHEIDSDPCLSPYRTRATRATNVAKQDDPSESDIHSTFDDDEYKDESSDEVNDYVLDLDYKGDLYEDYHSDGEESMKKYCVPSARGKGAGRKPNAAHPPKPDTIGMFEAEASMTIGSWEQLCKRRNNANRHSVAAAAALRDFDESIETCGKIYSGVTTKTLRQMNKVELSPLQLHHTFPSKETVMLQVAEEANLFGVRIQV
jgi:hypothetical protein